MESKTILEIILSITYKVIRIMNMFDKLLND